MPSWTAAPYWTDILPSTSFLNSVSLTVSLVGTKRALQVGIEVGMAVGRGKKRNERQTTEFSRQPKSWIDFHSGGDRSTHGRLPGLRPAQLTCTRLLAMVAGMCPNRSEHPKMGVSCHRRNRSLRSRMPSEIKQPRLRCQNHRLATLAILSIGSKTAAVKQLVWHIAGVNHQHGCMTQSA